MAEEEVEAAEEEEASRRGRAITVDTHHPEAEAGPSGELTPRHLSSETLGEHYMHCTSLTVSFSKDRTNEADYHDQPGGQNDLHGPVDIYYLFVVQTEKMKLR